MLPTTTTWRRDAGIPRSECHERNDRVDGQRGHPYGDTAIPGAAVLLAIPGRDLVPTGASIRAEIRCHSRLGKASAAKRVRLGSVGTQHVQSKRNLEER
jgi:hypothetical protein